jgi:hypothetical protein
MPNGRQRFCSKCPIRADTSGQTAGQTAIPDKRLQAKIFFGNVPEPDRSEGKVRRLEFPNG